MAAEFKLDGLDAALKKLRDLQNPKQVKSAVRSASTKAMRVVRDAARANSKGLDDPATASVIHKKIVTQFSSKQSKGDQVVTRVGIQGGAKPVKGDTDTGHWRLLEFGTSKMPAQPFMRRALDENYRKVADEFAQALEPAIDKVIAKGLR